MWTHKFLKLHRLVDLLQLLVLEERILQPRKVPRRGKWKWFLHVSSTLITQVQPTYQKAVKAWGNTDLDMLSNRTAEIKISSWVWNLASVCGKENMGTLRAYLAEKSWGFWHPRREETRTKTECLWFLARLLIRRGEKNGNDTAHLCRVNNSASTRIELKGLWRAKLWWGFSFT